MFKCMEDLYLVCLIEFFSNKIKLKHCPNILTIQNNVFKTLYTKNRKKI